MAKDNIATIEYKGNKYNMYFNINVMESIQEEYGSIDKWGEMCGSGTEPNLKAFKFGLKEILNEGVDIYNETHKDKREPLTDKQVGRMMSEVGMVEINEKLQELIEKSAGSDEKN